MNYFGNVATCMMLMAMAKDAAFLMFSVLDLEWFMAYNIAAGGKVHASGSGLSLFCVHYS